MPLEKDESLWFNRLHIQLLEKNIVLFTQKQLSEIQVSCCEKHKMPDSVLASFKYWVYSGVAEIQGCNSLEEVEDYYL